MRGFDYDRVIVSGISCVLPNNKIATKDYIGRFSKDAVEKFIQTTGIEQTYQSNGKQTASDLCYVAADRLMKAKKLSGEDIEALIFATQEPDYYQPASAFTIHKRLGIKQECLTFDMNIGCSAFTVGLSFIGGLIQGGMIQRALLLIGDAKLCPPQNDDHTDTMMFGAAGSAILLERGQGRLYGINMSDGNGYDVICAPLPGARFPDRLCRPGDKTHLANDDTFLFTITEVPKLFRNFFRKYECSMDDFDYCMLHQPNLMILKHIEKKLKITEGKMHVSINKFGNTDGATIPLGIVDLCEQLKGEKKLNLINSGFGVGLSWGIVAFELDTKNVMPIEFTDYYWEEGFRVGDFV